MQAPDSMRFVKAQFFFAFAVIGSVMPFLAVFLEQEQQFRETQIGYTMAVSSLAILITPALFTLLADTRMDPRRLLAFIFITSGTALWCLQYVDRFWPTLVCLALHSLAYAAVIPLQDGINFSIQRKREVAGQAVVPYHQTRVWGTVGFILPSVLLYGFLHYGSTTSVILISAAAFCAIGLFNSFLIPDPRVAARGDSSFQKYATGHGLPTREAIRVLLRRPVLIFCVGMFLAHLASAAYMGFYPLYLTKIVGVEEKWIGLIFNIGVAIEIFFILGYGRLLEWLGVRKLLVIGLGCAGLRMALLAAFPVPAIAVLTQAVHGLVVMAVQVTPPVYLNQQAGDRFRSSMQGIYAMAVMGTARIVGSIVAGEIAERSLVILFTCGAAVCWLAALLFLRGFEE